MKRKPLLIVLLIISVAFASMGASCKKHPADTVAPVVMKSTDVYQGIEEKLVWAKDNHIPGVAENWQKISDVRWKASGIYRKLWKAWYDLSLVNNPQNLAEVSAQLAALVAVLNDLLGFLPSGDPDIPMFKARLDTLKLEANQ